MKTPVSQMLEAARAAIKSGSVPKKSKTPYTRHVAAAAAKKVKVPEKNLTDEQWSSKLKGQGYDKKEATVFYYLRKKYGAIRKSLTQISFNSKFIQKKKGEKNEEVEENHFTDQIHKDVLDWEKNQH